MTFPTPTIGLLETGGGVAAFWALLILVQISGGHVPQNYLLPNFGTMRKQAGDSLEWALFGRVVGWWDDVNYPNCYGSFPIPTLFPTGMATSTCLYAIASYLWPVTTTLPIIATPRYPTTVMPYPDPPWFHLWTLQTGI